MDERLLKIDINEGLDEGSDEGEVCNDEEEENNVNKWMLESGNLIKELEGFNVDNLPKKYTINIKRAVLSFFIWRIHLRSSENILKD